jgi:haloacid dehalogenase-like hydrolase
MCASVPERRLERVNQRRSGVWHTTKERWVDEAALPGERVRATLSSRPHSAVLVDFDETLWLRSSTEIYLDSVRPRWLAVLVSEAVDLLRPWRLLRDQRSGFVYRDWLRVLLVSVLAPWSLPRWRRLAPALGRRWRNDDLLEALGEHGPRHVVTFGFAPVVRPLLAGCDSGAELTVSGGLWTGYRVRSAGKRSEAERALGARTVRESAVISDSDDDADLLKACRSPMLLRWAGAQYAPAFSESYVPFLYTRNGKRAGQKYLLHNVMLEDVVVLWLAFAWTSSRPVLTAAALLLLHLSFWLVYEIGYYENDHRAVLHEAKPNHPPGAATLAGRMKLVPAWSCALLLAVPGCLLLAAGAGQSSRLPSPEGWAAPGVVAVAWVSYLCAARSLYRVYNRLLPARRSFPYALLQLTRSAGYGVLLSTDATGAAVLGALVLARWIPYLVYRDLGVHPQGSHRLTMLLAFVVLGLLQTVTDPTGMLTVQALVALTYLTARAHRPLRPLLRPPSRSAPEAEALDGGTRR